MVTFAPAYRNTYTSHSTIMPEDLTEYFISIIQQYPSTDMADAEFKRAIADDDVLHRNYRDWCREQGTTEKRGFLDFCEEYIDTQNEVWDSLTDYDDE